MSASKPFSKSQYKLKTCRLRLIRKNEVSTLASTISSMNPWRSLGYSRKRLADFLRKPEPSCRRYLIIYSGQSAGVICVQYPWLRGAYIGLLAIFEGFKGKGIGGEVLIWLEEQTGSKYKNIWALVSSFNAQAREFYKKQGFKEVAALPDLVKPGFDEILIRKILP